MPLPSQPLRKLGFLTIGLFDEADPRAGHESTLEIIQFGERLGFDSAWVRHRHLQFGISSPVAVLAAASQRTSRIELGTAVIPVGWENPLRLAEEMPRHAGLWRELARRHGLVASELDALIGASWQYADMTWANPRPAAKPALVSTIKIRQAGFHACRDSEDMLLGQLARMQREKLLPP